MCIRDSTKDVICGALQTIEGDISRNDVSLERSVGNLYRKASCHDLLILHAEAGKLGRAGISAMEAHEGILMRIIEFADVYKRQDS